MSTLQIQLQESQTKKSETIIYGYAMKRASTSPIMAIVFGQYIRE